MTAHRVCGMHTQLLNVVRRCADGSIVSAVLYSHDSGRSIRRRAADAWVCLCGSCHCPDRLCSNAKTGRAGPFKHASLANRVRYDPSGASHGAPNRAPAVFFPLRQSDLGKRFDRSGSLSHAEPEYRYWSDIAQPLPLSRLARRRSSCRRDHH